MLRAPISDLHQRAGPIGHEPYKREQKGVGRWSELEGLARELRDRSSSGDMK